MPSTAVSPPTGARQEQPRLINRLTRHADVRETIEEYDRTADAYDQTFTDDVLSGPRFAAEALLSMFPEDGPVPRGHLKVIDVASGTGLVGQRLYSGGITNLDALEPSSEMIRISQRIGIYRRIIHDVIGHHRIDVADNTYDAAVVAGAFVPGHCPVTALDEMIRICKPGGYIVNTMRLEYLVTADEYNQMLTHMKYLTDCGLWRRVAHVVCDEYFEKTKQGITFIYQKV